MEWAGAVCASVAETIPDFSAKERKCFETSLLLGWGSFFNDGATNVSVFFDHYDRGNINAQEDPRWGAGDHRPFVDDDSPWKTSTSFRNLSSNSLYGQFDMVS